MESDLENLFSLKGQTALVTGGAGMFGRQIVEALADAGARVFVGSRNQETLELFPRELAASGRSVEIASYDQGDEASVLSLRDRIVEAAGSCEILVNNAVLRVMKSDRDPLELL